MEKQVIDIIAIIISVILEYNVIMYCLRKHDRELEEKTIREEDEE